MTRDELGSLSAQIDGEERVFSPRALEEIGYENKKVDWIWTLSAALFHPERHFTNEELRASSQRLVDLRQEILAALRRDTPDGEEARKKIGQALHGIQDFYSHSTWVELGMTQVQSRLGTETLFDPPPSVHPCPEDPNRLSADAGMVLSSAYYVGLLGCNETALPEGKCYHGIFSLPCVGINKDLDAAAAEEYDVEMSEDHLAAYGLAAQATRVFVQGLLDDLSGDDAALAALLDVRSDLCFVIDRTSSMGDEIDQVKDVVQRLVDEVESDGAHRTYVLLTYGDPEIGSPVVTNDPAELLTAVEGIVLGTGLGNPECAEPTHGALRAAIEAVRPNSDVLLFTDASSKDSQLAHQVVTAAQQKGVRVSFSLSDSCSPFDPTFFRVAEETGGQVFLPKPTEVSQLFGFIRPQVTGDQQLLERRRGVLEAGTTEAVAVAVDSTVDELLVSLTAEGVGALRLFRPSGGAVAAADADVEATDLDSGRLLTVAEPEAGAWRVEVEGAGDYSLAVHGASPLAFASFAFVRPNGEGDVHGGYFPVAGQPLAGTPELGEAVLLGAPFADAAFVLVDEAGESLSTLSLERGSATADRAHFLGDVPLPAVPFRVAAVGGIGDGTTFRRLFPEVYTAQDLALENVGAPSREVVPGTELTFRFRLTNHGDAASFEITAGDEDGFVAAADPAALTLGEGESGEISLEVTVPAAAEPGTSSLITLSTGTTDGSGRRDAAQAFLGVIAPDAGPQDVDGDGILDRDEDAGPNGGDGNDDGYLDSTQQGVVTLPAAGGDAYLTLVADCALRGVSVQPEDGLAQPDAEFEFPLGVVRFTADCAEAHVELLDHSASAWSGKESYRKYVATTPGEVMTTAWTTLPDVVFETVALPAGTVRRASFTLRDGELGDDSGVDGVIVDPGAPALPVADDPAVAVPTLSPALLLLLACGLVAAAWWRLR